jgi:pyrroloquinoline quinone biosynthesis protein B
LINAASDLAAQIEACQALQPDFRTPRNSPIAGVLLTNADLDHLLGLFSMREGSPLHIHATSATWAGANGSLGVSAILDVFCGTIWHEPPTVEFAPLVVRSGAAAGLTYRAIELPGGAPAFARKAPCPGAHSVAYQFLDQRTGGRLLVAPDVGGLNDALIEALSDSDAVLFDGTFWSDDELCAVKPNAPKASGMGHVTIRDCSLDLLGKLAARQKIYIHINNTNPILALDAPERAAVEAAGIVVGSDGLEFHL